MKPQPARPCYACRRSEHADCSVMWRSFLFQFPLWPGKWVSFYGPWQSCDCLCSMR